MPRTETPRRLLVALNTRLDGPIDGRPPLLLVHAFAGSIRAWDRMIDALAEDRRVVRVDLLGHGDSPKPADGYAMHEQAAAVCATLDRLGIDEVIAVGHSGGGDVVVAMIEHLRERVAGAVLLGTPPNLSYVDLPLTARALSAPILGRALWATVSDKMIRDGLDRTFAPSFRADAGAYAGLAADLRRMTHRSYVRARAAVEGYRKRRDLPERIGDAEVPLLVVFGDQDQWVDPRAVNGWAHVAETTLLENVGHTPLIEAPSRTARLILDFAARVQSVAVT